MQNLLKLPMMKNIHQQVQRGFTLIELMIVVIVIGILIKMAIPAYTASVQRSIRNDAKTALLDLATREEKFYSVNNQYTNNAAALYGGTTSFPLSVRSGDTAYYTISAPTITAASGATAASFSAQASRISGTTQATDTCGDFTINSAGVTGNVNNTANNCW